MPHANKERILVIHVGALGDCILALPALAALRRRFPEAYIELAGYLSPHGLLERRSPVNRVISVETLGLHRIFSGAVPEDVATYLRSFDVIISWFGYGDDAYRRALESLGQEDRPRHVLIARSRPPEGSREHAADYVLGTLAPLGVEAEDRTPRLMLLPEDHEAAEQILQDLWGEGSPERSVPLIVVHPGSGSPRKCWPVEYFAQLVRALDQPDRRFLIIEGPADGDRARRLLALCVGDDSDRSRRFLLVTRPPLPQLAALCARAQLFIGNDSGVTHLAAAVGAPVIALFIATDPVCWGPRGRVRILDGTPSVADALTASVHVLEQGIPDFDLTRRPRSRSDPIRSPYPR
jgi:ADP-heptose:LPS heptosyltransferase